MPNRSKLLPCLRLLSKSLPPVSLRQARARSRFAGATGEMALSAIGTDGKAYNFTYKIK